MDDPILFWNAVTNECNRLDHTVEPKLRTQAGPTLSSRATAMAHIAMHDAYVLSRAGLGIPVATNDRGCVKTLSLPGGELGKVHRHIEHGSQYVEIH